MTSKILQERQQQASAWFRTLQGRICAAFEQLEDENSTSPSSEGSAEAGRFERKSWERPGGGGGTMAIMKGQTFEKVGVNVSTVHGVFSEEFRGQMPGADEDPRFWASGISLVAHMHSPLVPAVHMNTRFIATTRTWFGGGADMTPYFPDEVDTSEFHAALKAACDSYDPASYEKYKKWCDDYFYLPHRQEPRGVGGIFYDNLDSGDWDADFRFTQGVGTAFLEVYPRIVAPEHDPPMDC